MGVVSPRSISSYFFFDIDISVSIIGAFTWSTVAWPRRPFARSSSSGFVFFMNRPTVRLLGTRAEQGWHRRAASTSHQSVHLFAAGTGAYTRGRCVPPRTSTAATSHAERPDRVGGDPRPPRPRPDFVRPGVPVVNRPPGP